MDSRYDVSLTYQPESRSVNRNRGRQIIRFNPPYNSVKTNVGKKFLALIKKNFPHNHFKVLSDIQQELTQTQLYCCTPNMGNIIKQYNAKVSKEKVAVNYRQCNCRVKQNCPLNGKCLSRCIVYKTEVNTSSEKHSYYGQN